MKLLNPKFETRNSKQIRISNALMTKTVPIGRNRIMYCLDHLNFCHLILFRISYFVVTPSGCFARICKSLIPEAEPSNSDSHDAGQAWPIEDPALRGRIRFLGFNNCTKELKPVFYLCPCTCPDAWPAIRSSYLWTQAQKLRKLQHRCIQFDQATAG